MSHSVYILIRECLTTSRFSSTHWESSVLRAVFIRVSVIFSIVVRSDASLSSSIFRNIEVSGSFVSRKFSILSFSVWYWAIIVSGLDILLFSRVLNIYIIWKIKYNQVLLLFSLYFHSLEIVLYYFFIGLPLESRVSRTDTRNPYSMARAILSESCRIWYRLKIGYIYTILIASWLTVFFIRKRLSIRRREIPYLYR